MDMCHAHIYKMLLVANEKSLATTLALGLRVMAALGSVHSPRGPHPRCPRGHTVLPQGSTAAPRRWLPVF